MLAKAKKYGGFGAALLARAAIRKQVGLAHIDACVNTGVAQAAKFLQRSVGTRDDGVILKTGMGLHG